MFKRLFNKLIFKKVKTKTCSFCNCNERADTPFIIGEGDNSSICSDCVISAYKILFGYVEPVSDKEVYSDNYEDIDFFDAIRKKDSIK